MYLDYVVCFYCTGWNNNLRNSFISANKNRSLKIGQVQICCHGTCRLIWSIIRHWSIPLLLGLLLLLLLLLLGLLMLGLLLYKKRFLLLLGLLLLL